MKIQCVSTISSKGGEIGANEQFLTSYLIKAYHNPRNQSNNTLNPSSEQKKEQNGIKGIISLYKIKLYYDRSRCDDREY